ncbi:uncharacterized protein LOC111490440 isoform X1 [Cucurbita maxima]|uniref:Uncharacterized protein LOC111490440 isoform X1 n=1 Tax=Cucurbita maxima TaxID=3661 RepID=A0A6J1K0E0_CUCMA|nr:uncharacterized protein LOC111490440 isoform X1 [Cucurbita maxima]XP_022994830.1 uncharacterized protein LOC111490440 isoform X1 [Cucurbita maxima]XP_022994831.1 uncharacterized protein LOC111490440 isoform X1 [Cucurbita maxima]
MPSGVKKRKAARKKKEQEAKINSSTGDEDCKGQNGRSSESLEVNATYDHYKCYDQVDGNNEKLVKNDSNASPVLSAVDEDKSLDVEGIKGNKGTIHELGFDGNGAIEVEKEFTSAENNARQCISSEYIEAGKKFDEWDDKNSSSSSAEECNIDDKKTEAYASSYTENLRDDIPRKSSSKTIGINESASVGECINSLVETLVADSVKSKVPVSTEKICYTKVEAGENLVVSDTVTSGLKEDANTLLSNQCAGTRVSSFTNLNSVPKENKDKVLAVTMENDQMSSSMMKQGSRYLEGKTRFPSDSPAFGASKDDAVTKDSEIPLCSKNKTLASAPIMAQRTSIFSCCGLFDLLKGIN